MQRHALTDAQWTRLKPLIPSPKRGPRSLRGDRLFVEAVLFRAATGVPWRDLPERFGPWKSVYNRFSRWAQQGHWEVLLDSLQEPDEEKGSIVDGSVVRAHQDASGGKGGSRSTRLGVRAAASRRSSMPSSTSVVAPSA